MSRHRPDVSNSQPLLNRRQTHPTTYPLTHFFFTLAIRNSTTRFVLQFRGSRGRVVKALDLKSNGVSPRRFEPCGCGGFKQNMTHHWSPRDKRLFLSWGLLWADGDNGCGFVSAWMCFCCRYLSDRRPSQSPQSSHERCVTPRVYNTRR